MCFTNNYIVSTKAEEEVFLDKFSRHTNRRPRSGSVRHKRKSCVLTQKESRTKHIKYILRNRGGKTPAGHSKRSKLSQRSSCIHKSQAKFLSQHKKTPTFAHNFYPRHIHRSLTHFHGLLLLCCTVSTSKWISIRSKNDRSFHK